ncbi:MAG: restriction endonuclease [Candidatus Thiodiazotropha endolucinida]
MSQDIQHIMLLIKDLEQREFAITFAAADAFDHGLQRHSDESQLPEVRKKIGELKDKLRQLGTSYERERTWNKLVKRLAHHLWEQRSGADGDAQNDWYNAEELIRDKLSEYAKTQIDQGKLSINNISQELIELSMEVQIDCSIWTPESYERLKLSPQIITILPPVERLLENVAINSINLAQLHWKEFEDLIGEILKKTGWITKPMGYTKDGGIDLIAIKNIDPGIPVEMLVQCKKYKRKIGVNIVREVCAVKWKYGFHQAMIATTSRFTKGARKEADELKLELKDHDDILSWIKNIYQ